MDPRPDVHEMICSKFGEIGKWVWNTPAPKTGLQEAIAAEARKHVYFQPPASVRLEYPCIIYKLEAMPIVHANNHPYHHDHSYQLTVIDRDPNSVIREKMTELPTCRFERFFVSDNLNHYVFRVYH